MCLVPSVGTLSQCICGHRRGRHASESHFPVRCVCHTDPFPRLAYLERGLRFGPGAAIHATKLAAHFASICCGWSHGVDGLLDAVRVVHLVLLSLHDWLVWPDRTSARARTDGHSVWSAGRVQQLVA